MSKFFENDEAKLQAIQSGKNPGDTFSISQIQDDTDFWEITTHPFPEAHFATYPEKLCEKPIKSSCPEWICIKCGFIRERISKEDISNLPYINRLNEPLAEREEELRKQSNFKSRRLRDVFATTIGKVKQTIGWTSCNCNAGWNPGIILDPFAGSGTTCLVARKLSRQFIGFELNQKYIEIANNRLKPYMEQKKLNEVLI